MGKMKYRKGIFAVVYAKTKKGKIEYLLLKRKLHWTGWEFPKGAVDGRETLLEAAKREAYEETGLKQLEIDTFDFSGNYKYDKKYEDRDSIAGQTFEAVFAVEVQREQVRLDSKEHSDYKWLDFEQAIKKLTWQNQREALKIVNKALGFRFREIKLSSGIKILLGKDRKQNEALINHFIEKPNLIFHTSARGSPFCVIDSLKHSKEDIKEAATICASYSQDWRDRKQDVIVHIFTGKDVYKKKDMPVGTFGIRKSKTIKVKKQDILKIKK